MVKEITSLSEYNNEINSFKGLIVIDFFTTWCGPCKAIAPFIENLSIKYPNVKFLKVDIEKNEDIAGPKQIQSIPTFHFMVKGVLLDEVKGANGAVIEEKVIKYKVDSVDPFQGSGYKMSSSDTTTASSMSAREARLKAFANIESSSKKNQIANTDSDNNNNSINSSRIIESKITNDDVDIEDEALAKALNLSVVDHHASSTIKKDTKAIEDDLEYANAAAEYDAAIEQKNTNIDKPIEHFIEVEGKEWEEEMVPVPVDESLLQQLIEMGFTDVSARKAIVHGKNMDGAMNWLDIHQDDDDINCPYLVKKSDIDNVAVKIPLTEDEKAARVIAIKNLVKQRQNEKLKLEKLEEIRREKERRERGQKIDETLEERQRLQRKREAERMKKEKDDAAKERMRLKAEIARDKEIRKANKGVLPSVLGVDGYNPSIIQYDQPVTTGTTTITNVVDNSSDTINTLPSKRAVNTEEAIKKTPTATSSTAPVKKVTIKDTSCSNASMLSTSERVDQAIQTIMRYRTGGDGGQALKLLSTFIKNIVSNPEESKYKSINTDSNAFKSKLASLVGPVILLKAIGFEKGVEDESKLSYTGDSYSKLLSETMEKLSNAERLYAQQNP